MYIRAYIQKFIVYTYLNDTYVVIYVLFMTGTYVECSHVRMYICIRMYEPYVYQGNSVNNLSWQRIYVILYLSDHFIDHIANYYCFQ